MLSLYAFTILLLLNPPFLTSWIDSNSFLQSSGEFQQYDRYAENYDFLDGGLLAKQLGLSKLRNQVGKFTSGKVLETAVGTGLQIPYYNWNTISEYRGMDISEGMLKKSREKVGSFPLEIQSKIYLFQANIEDLSLHFSSSTAFDSIIDTFAMCVFENPEQSLLEMKNVLSPSGKIILLENSRSTNPLLAWFQDISAPLIAKTSKGCRWNVDVPKLAEKSGLISIYSSDQMAGTIHLGVYQKSNFIK